MFAIFPGIRLHELRLAVKDTVRMRPRDGEGQGTLQDFGAQIRRLMRAGSWGCSQATRCDTGMPRRVIRFSTAQAARASVF